MRSRTKIFIICIIFIFVLAFLFLIFAPPLISMATESDEGDEAVAKKLSNAGDIKQAATSSSANSSNSESRPAEDAGSNNGRAMEALLIANSDYSNFPKLGSPKTDALILGDSLRKLGFATRLVENASREQMLDEIKAFEERLRSTRGIAFFHFGGHGIQVKGSNYLVPADADIPDERRVSTRAVELNEVMGALDASGSEVNIVVLDACRDNPLPASATRSATRGLAVVGNKPKNSIVIYAAEAGSKATDGLFTPVLARELATPGISLAEIMTRVRKEVNEKSGGSQTPGEYNQLFEQVYFTRGKQPEEADKPVANIEVPRTKASEDEIWNSDLRAENQDSGSNVEFKAINLVKKLISQENERDIEAQLHLYNDQAEIGGRILNIDEIHGEISTYYERWPRAEWVLLEDPVFNKIDSIRSEIVYKAKYRLESAPRKKWSSGLIVSTVGLVDKDGDLCITHIRDVTSDLRNGEFFEEVSDEEKASAVRSIDEDKTQNPPENVFGNNLHVYPKTKSMNFPNGYRLYDYDGNCIEKVNRSAWIQIKAISAENKFASKPAYLSEWSYLQLLEGKKPNWIINLDGN